ncbi:hypothetical protein D9758_003621 [Tetrapyrgos nigripes]|uniref:Uncharacterized protein n=1 Tax=Tetrapyrgos nigripes TaxID=182062 RepID=A0A8H5LS52_9AGAR|nr:hypothetical protein D9758_003621 [Tetrapyrgos nigripes]
MLPVANLHLRELASATVEFFALRSPSSSVPSPLGSDDETARTLTPIPDPIARLTRECAVLTERLDQLQADRRQSECPCRTSTSQLTLLSMRREFDETRRELHRTRVEVAKLEERCKSLEKALFETRELVRTKDDELRRIRGDGERGSLNGHGDGVLCLPGTSEEDQRAASFDESKALVKANDVFLTRTDSWSGAQVLQAIHDLNSEILQWSAAVTEIVTFTENSPPSASKAVIQATQDTASRLGPNLVKILSGRDHSQDPILVQLALQGCITTCVARALSVFCMGFPSKADSILTQIYGHMYAAEPQPSSSKWRALTHRHIHTMYPYLRDYSANELAETMYRWSADILLIAGCQNTDKLSVASRDGLRTRFGENVRRITKTACKLAQVAKEEIMSTCFEIIAVEHGEIFDPCRMMDTFGEYGVSSGSIVSTTELGLRCKTRKGRGTHEEHKGVVETEVRLLLPPKVILESVLEFVDPR